ncbi:hypothetical protein GCK32_020853, partial [Trichostrongylus colubriformis]
MPPMAVVGPRQCIRSARVTSEDRGRHHHSQNDTEQYRRSLQQLNASTLYSLQAVSYSESPLGAGDMSCSYSTDPCVTPRRIIEHSAHLFHPIIQRLGGVWRCCVKRL